VGARGVSNRTIAGPHWFYGVAIEPNAFRVPKGSYVT